MRRFCHFLYFPSHLLHFHCLHLFFLHRLLPYLHHHFHNLNHLNLAIVRILFLLLHHLHFFLLHLQRGGGGLGTLSKVVKEIVGSSASVEIVSVYGYPDSDGIHSSALPNPTPLIHPPVSTFACVWLSVRQSDGTYVDPVKLQGIFALNNRKVNSYAIIYI